jgi:signal transduction histidine kinase
MVQRDLVELRKDLGNKVIATAAAGTVVLIVGLFYVIHLIRKNRRLEESKQSADRRSYVGLLASGLAHEIRNPLNAMNMNLQMLEEEIQLIHGANREDYGELLDSTKSEIERLARLVNNFLAYARPARPTFRKSDLNQLIRDLVRFLEADFRQSGVEILMELEPMLPEAELDETQFKQAVMNLLVNARQILKKGGTIRVVTRPGAGGELVLEIQDDGPGIAREAQERIFEVFFSSRGGGTGLGLPIARQIVERHGGSMELDSVPGEGATFRIRVPRNHPGLPPEPEEDEI